MIWYNNKLILKDTPANIEVRLQGRYNRTGDNLIEILVIADGYSDILLYSHNPTMLSREEPQADDILYKYQAKINKALAKYKSFYDLYPESPLKVSP